MENIAQIIGLVLTIIGVVGLVQAAFTGNLSLLGILIPVLFIAGGIWLMRSWILVMF
jgi:hypothetical protein